jgi:ribosomal subunit interface protein
MQRNARNAAQATAGQQKGGPHVDIIVKGRHTDVSERFRRHVDTKLAKIERLDQKVIRVDVEVSQEHNPRLSDQRERVELTIRSKGPAIRAEAAADDRYGALDLAFDKLESRLRRNCDRRKGHNGQRERVAAKLLAETAYPFEPRNDGAAAKGGRSAGTAVAELQAEDYAPPAEPEDDIVPIPMEGDGPLVVREKFHQAEPMEIEQALFEMELVGHDFFLFRDVACGKPSVVYRRRGWDYGVIRLVEE